MTIRSDAPTRHVLPNGLKVILKEQHGSPVVALQAWVGVGSADEPEEVAGIAHVFEHMLFKGTARRGVGAIAREVESAGGDINAWTSFDQTVYHLVLASRFVDEGLDILTDALRFSSFDEGELARELKVVLEEVKQGEDSPSRVVTQALFSSAFGSHNYRRPVIGYAETVARFRRKTVVEFWKRYYGPNNITLVAVGDFDRERALSQIAKLWRGDKARPLPPRPVMKAARVTASRKPRVSISGGEVAEAHLVFGFPLPPLRHDDVGAIDVGAIILGHGDSSRLQRAVKREQQLVNDAYAYSFTPRDPGLFVVGATLSPDKIDDALAALARETFRLARTPAAPEELAKAKAIVESDAVYQKETVQGMARKLGFYECVAGGLEHEEVYVESVRATTHGSLAETMARYAKPEACTISLLLPRRSAELESDRARKALATRLSARLVEAATSFGPPARRGAIVREEPRAAHAQAPAPRAEVVREVLPSGMRVLVLRDPSVPLVSMRGVWLGGLREETEADNGASNLIASLLTRGTERRGGDEIAHEIESLAGSIGGFSGKNSLGLRAEVMSRHFEHGLEVLADCAQHATFPELELEREKRHVLEEIRAEEDNASHVAFSQFARALYPSHPYRLDLLGTPESVRRLDRARLRDFFAERYTPDRLTLAIVGDVDPETAIAQATRLFGGASHASAALRSPPFDRPPSEPLRVERTLQKQQAHLVIGFTGTTIADPDRYALEVLTTILSGQGGRLFVELREKRGLAYRVSAFSLEGIDPGYVAVYVATSPENLGLAEERMRAEIAKVIARPVPRAELERAKRYLAGAHDISLQRRSALASTLAWSECYGLGFDQYRTYAPRVLAVTAADVQRVAATYLDVSRAVISCVKPEAAVGAAEPRAIERAARAVRTRPASPAKARPVRR